MSILVKTVDRGGGLILRKCLFLKVNGKKTWTSIAPPPLFLVFSFSFFLPSFLYFLFFLNISSCINLI